MSDATLDFSTIKFIISGAAPLSASIQDEAMKRIKAPIVIGERREANEGCAQLTSFTMGQASV